MIDKLKEHRYEMLILVLFIITSLSALVLFESWVVRFFAISLSGCLYLGVYYLRELIGRWKSLNKWFFVIFLISLAYTLKGTYSIFRCYTINTYYGIAGITAGILLVYLLELIYVGLFIRKWRIENLFLISALLLGPVYMINLPINTTPDEDYHYNSAYKLSSVLMGYNRFEDESFVMRKCDFDYELPNHNYDFEEMEAYLQTFTEPCGNTVSVVNPTARVMNSSKSAFMHLVPGIGITIARLLGLNTELLGIMGRLGNFLVYLLVGFWALKKMPFNKPLLFGTLLLPMSLQQCTSLSYDTIAISLSVFTIAYGFNLLEKNKIEKYEYFVMIISMLILFFTKSKAYFAVALFPLFLMLLKRTGILQKYQKVIRNIGIIAGFVAVFYVVYTAATGGNMFAEPDRILVLDNTEFQGYTIQYCLNHPLEIFNLYVNTSVQYIYGYMTMMLGSALGWVNVRTPDLAIFVFSVLLILFAFKRKGVHHKVSKYVKIYFFVAILITYVGVLTALLLDYTPLGFLYVYGVQGRYFLPIMIPLLLLLHSDSIEVDQKLDRYLLFFFICNAVFTVLSIYPRL